MKQKAGGGKIHSSFCLTAELGHRPLAHGRGFSPWLPEFLGLWSQIYTIDFSCKRQMVGLLSFHIA